MVNSLRPPTGHHDRAASWLEPPLKNIWRTRSCQGPINEIGTSVSGL
jgi:hypothetical protein